ncbi:hypothetical protein BV25DRAFT_1803919 [Artomyces pyxidatus]|uniref:Uncharacterized protein n=1 Tax=Artomyces pyxidatus TaxID=48021 RepID=A0ACB8T191_9AGAM|nr:hypothetical protein BV25DRAFT_1803919 [Artomyces pyxidatus]
MSALLDKLHRSSLASKLNPKNHITHKEDKSDSGAQAGGGDGKNSKDSDSVASTPSSSSVPSTTGSSFVLPSPASVSPAQSFTATRPIGEKEGIAELVAEYGSSSATAWLEFERYKIWRPDVDIPHSSFTPVQGYLRDDPYIFAWGNPLVSDKAALEATCAAFIEWAKPQKLRVVWLCVDEDMQKVLGSDKFKWSTLSCIVEDILEPHTVVEIATSDTNTGGSKVKDFKKNLRRAEREDVVVREIQHDAWTDDMKHEVEDGILNWKKSRSGAQIASTSFQPWLDFEHRRYWIAEKDHVIVGILILAPIGPTQYQIKNAVSFPNAPRGTSEELIFRAMQDLDGGDRSISASASGADSSSESDSAMVWSNEEEDRNGASSPEGVTPPGSRGTSPARNRRGVTVTFGVSASSSLTPVDNLSGWKVTWLSKTYNHVVGGTGLTRRGDFRSKFQSEHTPMYVCYASEEGFGIDGVNKLMKALRQ